MTRLYVNNNYLIEEFVALLDISLPSETLLRITEAVYNSLIQIPSTVSSLEPQCASYRILNDGTPHKASIICGYNPGLYTRCVYDIVVTSKEEKGTILHWREPHIIIEDDGENVAYWEEFSIMMSAFDSGQANNLDYTKHF